MNDTDKTLELQSHAYNARAVKAESRETLRLVRAGQPAAVERLTGLLREHHGNLALVARLLRISRQALHLTIKSQPELAKRAAWFRAKASIKGTTEPMPDMRKAPSPQDMVERGAVAMAARLKAST